MVLVLVQWRQLAVCVFIPSTIPQQQPLIHYHKGTPPMPSVLLRSAPHPRLRSAVELQGCNLRCSLDLFSVGKVWPANASLLNSRHHASCRFSQHAPTGMKTCSTRGRCFSSHSRIGGLL